MQEKPKQQAGRGLAPDRKTPQPWEQGAGFMGFYSWDLSVEQPAEALWCALSVLPATKDEGEEGAVSRQERLHPADRSWLLLRGISADAEVLL